MKTNSLFIFAAFLITLAYQSVGSAGAPVSASTVNRITPLKVGGDANTNFENLNCSQMIAGFLRHLGVSGRGQEGIDNRFRSCVARARSGVIGGAFAYFRIKTAEVEECYNVAVREQREYQEAKSGFITALAARENLYNVGNISDLSYFYENSCRANSQTQMQRRANELDEVYATRIMHSCNRKYEASSARNTSFRTNYRNPSDYSEYEVCLNYRIAYNAEQNPPLPSNREEAIRQAQAPESTASRGPVCQTLTCGQVMSPHAMNNPSPCYRNAVINCMSGVDANAGAVTAPARSNANQ